LNHIQDDDTKDKILGEFEKGEITNMMYGIEMWVEEERQKSEATGIKKGKAEGIAETQIEMAMEMLQDGVDIAAIAKYTKMPLKDIEGLRAKIKGNQT
jgi:predicted transposase YdaD